MQTRSRWAVPAGCATGKELEPNWKMMMFERLGAPGEESSNGFNNAGTMAWCQTRTDEPIKIYQTYVSHFYPIEIY